MKETYKKRNVAVAYSGIQGCYYMNGAAILGFTSVYLLDNGVSNTEIGLIYGIAGLIAAILQTIIAGYADEAEAVSVKILLIWSNFLAVGFDILLFSFYHRWTMGSAWMYGCAIGMLLLQLPFINALGTESVNQGKKLNFGLTRGVGSVMYAVMSYILGVLAAKSTAFIPLGMLFCNVGMLLFLFAMPFEKSAGENEMEKFYEKNEKKSFLSRYPRYTVVLVGTVLLYISYVFMNNYVYQIVQSKGGGSAEMGIAVAFAACSEIPVMFGYSYLMKKISSGNWFRISGIFIFLKALASWMTVNVAQFYMIQILQVLGFALFTVSSVFYINESMEPKDAIKGQAYFTMMYTMANVFAPLLAGRMIDKYGVHTMLATSTIFGFFGAVVVFCGAKGKTIQ